MDELIEKLEEHCGPIEEEITREFYRILYQREPEDIWKYTNPGMAKLAIQRVIREIQANRPALEAGMQRVLRVESTTHWSPDCGWNLNDGTFYVPWHRSCVIKFAQSLGLTAEFVEDGDDETR